MVDACQHHGVGTVLLALLMDRAREEGVGRFVGEVLSQNAAMHHLMASSARPSWPAATAASSSW